MSKSAAVSLIQEAFGVALEVIELYNVRKTIQERLRDVSHYIVFRIHLPSSKKAKSCYVI